VAGGRGAAVCEARVASAARGEVNYNTIHLTLNASNQYESVLATTPGLENVSGLKLKLALISGRVVHSGGLTLDLPLGSGLVIRAFGLSVDSSDITLPYPQ